MNGKFLSTRRNRVLDSTFAVAVFALVAASNVHAKDATPVRFPKAAPKAVPQKAALQKASQVTPTPPPLATLPPAAKRFKPLAVPMVVRSPAWIVVDVDSGRVLEAFNPHRRMFPASTTKTLTALVAISQGHLDETVAVGANPPKTGEQSAYLLQGEQFKLRDLVRAALIKSANDACVALAEGVGGNVPNFVKMMNAKAREVGALDSHFANPHGLHDPNHYTTPYDLAQIARAAMRYPFFNQTVRTRDAQIHGNWKIGPVRVLENKNRLLWEWSQCDGVKTGYTRQAGHCLIASATRRVRDKDGAVRPWRLIAVVMHSPDSWGEGANLLLNAFHHFQPMPVVEKGQSFASVDVQGGAAQVQPVAPRNVEIPLRQGETLTRRFRYAPLKAPLRRGQQIGELELWSGSHPVARVPLIARSDVSVSLLARVAPSAPFALNNTFFLAAAGAAALSLLLLLLRRARKPLRSHHV